MYSFTEGDRVWVSPEWDHDEQKIGYLKRVLPNGNALAAFAQWSEIMFSPDGFSLAGFYRIVRHVSKEELDLTRRI